MAIGVTVNQVITPSNSIVQRITGTKEIDVFTVLVNGSSDGVFFGPDDTWFYDAKLSSGLNRFDVQGADSTNAKGQTVVVQIVFNSITNTREEAANHLDLFGLEMNVRRIRGEKNLHLKNRLLDVFSNPGGVAYRGMLNNIARALSFRIINDALSISIGKTSSLFSTVSSAIIWSNTKYIYIETLESKITGEIHTVPSTKIVKPVFNVTEDQGLKISTISGNALNADDWEFELESGDILIINDSLVGSDIKIEYIYTRKVDLNNKTIQEVADEISLIEDTDGNSVFDVVVKNGLEARVAENLAQTGFTILGKSSTLDFAWTPFRFFQLHDEDVWRSELNDEGTVFGTDLEAWINFIREHASVTWENVKLDRDTWITENQVNWNTFEPHILDNKKGEWRCANPSHKDRFDLYGFKENSGVCPLDGLSLVYKGVLPMEFQSGVGFGTNLKVSIVESDV